MQRPEFATERPQVVLTFQVDHYLGLPNVRGVGMGDLGDWVSECALREHDAGLLITSTFCLETAVILLSLCGHERILGV